MDNQALLDFAIDYSNYSLEKADNDGVIYKCQGK